MTIIPITKEQEEELIKEEINKADNRTKKENMTPTAYIEPKRLTIFHWFKHIIYADYWQRKRKKRGERTLLHMQFETKQDIVREQDRHKENIARMENKLLNIQGKLLQYESETKR